MAAVTGHQLKLIKTSCPIATYRASLGVSLDRWPSWEWRCGFEGRANRGHSRQGWRDGLSATWETRRSLRRQKPSSRSPSRSVW